MIFRETELNGVLLIVAEASEDERGWFVRTYCRRQFETAGLDSAFVQCSVSFNRRRGTLRGLHFQAEPFEETKLVCCTRGSIYDVIVDLRPNSPSYRKWIAHELSPQNCHMLYVPRGLAHGFQTLEDESQVLYQISEYYRPEAARGYRYDDPAFGIQWPPGPRILSARDESHPAFLHSAER